MARCYKAGFKNTFNFFSLSKKTIFLIFQEAYIQDRNNLCSTLQYAHCFDEGYGTSINILKAIDIYGEVLINSNHHTYEGNQNQNIISKNVAFQKLFSIYSSHNKNITFLKGKACVYLGLYEQDKSKQEEFLFQSYKLNKAAYFQTIDVLSKSEFMFDQEINILKQYAQQFSETETANLLAEWEKDLNNTYEEGPSDPCNENPSNKTDEQKALSNALEDENASTSNSDTQTPDPSLIPTSMHSNILPLLNLDLSQPSELQPYSLLKISYYRLLHQV